MSDDTHLSQFRSRTTSSPDTFRRAHERYRPERLRLLFIAEAPPAYRTNRLFYFPDLSTGDALFLEMMKVIYARGVGFAEGEGFLHHRSARDLRSSKSELLERFMADGYYLIDTSPEPLPDNASSSVKLALLRKALPGLKERLRTLIGGRKVPVILIGGVTYLACYDLLRTEGHVVVNDEMINHPARGGQVLFRQKLRRALHRVGMKV